MFTDDSKFNPHLFLMNQYNTLGYAPQSPRGNPLRSQNTVDQQRPYKSNHQGVAPESRLSGGLLSSPMKPFQQTQAEVGREAEESAWLKKLKHDRETLEIRVEHLERENKNLLKQVRQRDDEIGQKSSLNSEITNIKRMYADLAQKFEQVNKEYKNLKEDLQPLKKDLKERDQQVKELQEKISQLKEKQKPSQKQDQENKDLKTRIQLLEKTIVRLKENKDTSESDKTLQGINQSKTNEQVRNLQQQILDQKKDLSAKIKTLLDENDKLRNLTKQSEISSNSSPLSTDGTLNQILKGKSNEIKKLVAENSYLKEMISNQQQQNSRSPRASDEQKEIMKLKNTVQQLQRQINDQSELSRSPSVFGSEGVRQSEKFSDNSFAMIQLEMKVKQLSKEKIDQIQELKVTHAQELNDLKDEYQQEMQVYLRKIRDLESNQQDNQTSKNFDNQKVNAQLKKLQQEVVNQEIKIKDLLYQRDDQEQLYQQQAVEMLELKKLNKDLRVKLDKRDKSLRASVQDKSVEVERSKNGSPSSKLTSYV